LVVAYDMYKEVVEEGFAAFGFDSKEEAIKNCMLDFHSFRNQLAMQGLPYNPKVRKYKGDLAMRVNTKRGAANWNKGEKRGRGCPRRNVTPDGGVPIVAPPQVTLGQLKHQKRPMNGRLCGDLTKYMYHQRNIETVKHKLVCKFCAKDCYTRCKICKLACHDNPARGSSIGSECFTSLQNDQCFGLAFVDCKLLKTNQKTWTEPKKRI
jgi:hypothetical protein